MGYGVISYGGQPAIPYQCKHVQCVFSLIIPFIRDTIYMFMDLILSSLLHIIQDSLV